MKVAVIGAGLSGLTFAAAMNKLAPGVEIGLYERDESSTSRPQGYAIGLRNGFGLQALAGLGLREPAIGKDAYKVTDFAILDQQGNRLLSLPSGEHGPNTTYRIQRVHLKKVLLEAIGDTPINYGMRCTRVEQNAATATAKFEDGRQVEADYLISCDGAGSSVRQQLIGDQKLHLGLNSIHFESRLDVQHPFLEGGYFLMLGNNGCSFFCYRQSGGVYWSYVLHAGSEGETANLPWSDLLERVHHDTADWHELVPRIVAAAVPETVGVRGYYDKEPISKVRVGRIWMIGDAAHPMCPFQGQGANMAIMDAVRLGTYFSGDIDDVAKAAALEADVVKRGRQHVRESRANAKRFHLTSSWGQAQRNFAFHVGDFFIGMFSKHD